MADLATYAWNNGFTLLSGDGSFLMWGVTPEMAASWNAKPAPMTHQHALAQLGVYFNIAKCHGVTHLVCEGPGYEYRSNSILPTQALTQELIKTLGLDVCDAEVSGSMPALCADQVAEPMPNRIDQIDDELMMGVITVLLVISLYVALHVPVVDTVRHAMSRASRYASRLFTGEDHGAAPQADVNAQHALA